MMFWSSDQFSERRNEGRVRGGVFLVGGASPWVVTLSCRCRALPSIYEPLASPAGVAVSCGLASREKKRVSWTESCDEVWSFKGSQGSAEG